MAIYVLLKKWIHSNNEQFVGAFSSEVLSLKRARELDEEDPGNGKSYYWIHQLTDVEVETK